MTIFKDAKNKNNTTKLAFLVFLCYTFERKSVEVWKMFAKIRNHLSTLNQA